jgi:hypothetical protein
MTPEEIVSEAGRLNFSCIAITDHDTLDGIKTLAGKCAPSNLKIIRGIEFSAHMPQHEVHILGLGIDIENAALNERLKVVRASRWTRLDKMLAKLQKLGYEKITKDAVLKSAGATKSVGRAHIAAALVEHGYFKTVADAFNELLHKGAPVYEPHYRLEVAEIVRLVHDAGGKALIAHPALVRDDKTVRCVIEGGMDGIEVYHPRHDAAAEERYLAMAKEYGLYVSGGSDFHAIPTRYPEKLGVFTVADEKVASLVSAL